MFRNVLLTLAVSFLLICIPSMVILAQDSPPDAPVSESQLNMIAFTTTDILQPEIIQQLHDIGLTSEDVEEIQGIAIARDSSSYNSAVTRSSMDQESFFCPCAAGDTSNVIFQTGPGYVNVLHEYSNGFTVNVGTMTCPAHAVFCIWAASSQRPGLSPSWFLVHHSSHAHRIHWWCS